MGNVIPTAVLSFQLSTTMFLVVSDYMPRESETRKNIVVLSLETKHSVAKLSTALRD